MKICQISRLEASRQISSDTTAFLCIQQMQIYSINQRETFKINSSTKRRIENVVPLRYCSPTEETIPSTLPQLQSQIHKKRLNLWSIFKYVCATGKARQWL